MKIIKKVETKNGRLVVLAELTTEFGEEFLLGVCNKGDEISFYDLAGKKHFNKGTWTLEEVIKERFNEYVDLASKGYIFG